MDGAVDTAIVEKASEDVDDDDDAKSTAINPVNDAYNADIHKDQPSKEESKITQRNDQIAAQNFRKVQKQQHHHQHQQQRDRRKRK